MTFKVGDRVRYRESDNPESIGVITTFSKDRVWVQWEDIGHHWSFEDDLELVSQDGSPFEQSVRYHTNKIADLLIAKNKAYSNSALDPIRVFSKSDRQEQLRVRADDKLSRIRNGDTSEDAVMDLCGYLILLKIAEASE